jgi:hypothetical protein
VAVRIAVEQADRQVRRDFETGDVPRQAAHGSPLRSGVPQAASPCDSPSRG